MYAGSMRCQFSGFGDRIKMDSGLTADFGAIGVGRDEGNAVVRIVPAHAAGNRFRQLAESVEHTRTHLFRCHAFERAHQRIDIASANRPKQKHGAVIQEDRSGRRGMVWFGCR